MKFILIAAILSGFQLNAQRSAYDFSITDAKGNFISLSDFKGKRLVIATVAKQSLETKTAFKYWDSIQKANPAICFFIIPMNDFGSDSTSEISLSATKANPAGVSLSRAVSAKKGKGEKQDPLLKWLTNASENGHFDEDVFADQQMFVISEAGVLYAVIGKGTRSAVLNEILNQAEIKYQ